VTGVQIAVAPLINFADNDLVRFPCRLELNIALSSYIYFIATITSVLLPFSQIGLVALFAIAYWAGNGINRAVTLF
jgi:hypothetical protein